ncbi:MAG: ATP-binding protein [Victivallales bacterium]|nr:ATP-binding protein [Victivallales bacterium]
MQPSRRILIVAHQPELREQLSRTLRRYGQADATATLVRQMRCRLGASRQPAPKPDGPEPEPYEVDTAVDADAAGEMIRRAWHESHPYTVMFIDDRQPAGPEGSAAARRLCEIDPALEIVIMSDLVDATHLRLAAVAAAPEKLLYLKKPFQEEEVLQLAAVLTSKWNFAATEYRHREWLETLLRGLSRIKTMVGTSVGEHYAAVLRALLQFAGASRGFIADEADAGTWELRHTVGLEQDDVQDFLHRHAVDLRGSKTTRQCDGKYVIPLQRETLAAIVVIYDTATNRDPEWYKMISLLAMTAGEVLYNAIICQTAMRKMQLNHLDRAVRKMTEMEAALLDRIVGESENAGRVRQEVAAAQRQLAYIRHTMDMIDGDFSRFVPQNIRPAQLLTDARDAVARLFPSCKLTVTVAGAAELQLLLPPDPLRMVLETLLANSCESALAAGRHAVAVGMTIDAGNHQICLRYSDDGPGIPAAVRDSIFEPFAATAPNKIGIGLAASRIIMEKMAGGLFLNPDYRDGASFAIKLARPQH